MQIPFLSSLILTYTLNGEVKGLDAFPRADWPNVDIVFWTFRIMVGIAFAMLGFGLWSLWTRWKGSIHEATSLQRTAVTMGPAEFVAVLCGWISTEVGRQPLTVYGLLRTSESHSPIAAEAVGTSLIAFIVIYFPLFGAGTYYILRLMKAPPHPDEQEPSRDEPTRTVIAFAGLGINFFPNIIPPDVTIWEAAAPRDSQIFLLVGASVLIPLILAYTGYAYRVFRGKVVEGEGYHH